jgi:hypothetical protein
MQEKAQAIFIALQEYGAAHPSRVKERSSTGKKRIVISGSTPEVTSKPGPEPVM